VVETVRPQRVAINRFTTSHKDEVRTLEEQAVRGAFIYAPGVTFESDPGARAHARGNPTACHARPWLRPMGVPGASLSRYIWPGPLNLAKSWGRRDANP
jgi:hypothetical protein